MACFCCRLICLFFVPWMHNLAALATLLATGSAVPVWRLACVVPWRSIDLRALVGPVPGKSWMFVLRFQQICSCPIHFLQNPRLFFICFPIFLLELKHAKKKVPMVWLLAKVRVGNSTAEINGFRAVLQSWGRHCEWLLGHPTDTPRIDTLQVHKFLGGFKDVEVCTMLNHFRHPGLWANDPNSNGLTFVKVGNANQSSVRSWVTPPDCRHLRLVAVTPPVAQVLRTALNKLFTVGDVLSVFAMFETTRILKMVLELDCH